MAIVTVVTIVMIVMIVPVIAVMMMDHRGIGIEHAGLDLHGLGDWRGLGGGAGGKRRRGEKAGCEQRSGNGLQHDGLLLQLKPSGVPVGWPVPSIVLATLTAAR